MARAHWSSRIGFIFAAAGSAVGLGNIWRMPFIVGENGGAAFLLVYLVCLALIGFPVLIAEMLIGQTTQTSPGGAFQRLGGNKVWRWVGLLTILTGFIVSSFYSAVAGWIFGYLVEALKGNLSAFDNPTDAALHFDTLIANPFWGVGFHALFLAACVFVLCSGVRGGIERGNKVMMPMLFALLFLLVCKGLTLTNAMAGVTYLFSPDWSHITPAAVLIALGQSFFTLSLGQGTMVTYGSYLHKKENLLVVSAPVVLMDTLASLLAAVAVFTIVFAGGMRPDSGPGLIFHTLPVIFNEIPGGVLAAIMFFFLVLIAALTSEISAMEPAIAYLIDEWGWKRHSAVLFVGIGVFLFGLPSALSSSVLAGTTLFGMSCLDFISFAASSILVPLGGFFAVILVGWIWGVPQALERLREGAADLFAKYPVLRTYFWLCFKYTAPILMIVVFLSTLGLFA